MVEKAYKFRLYPTPQQESLLRKTLGWVRLVYNKALAARTQAWYEHQERVGYKQTSAMLTNWKKQEDLDFLSEVSSVPLQQGLRHLQTAFTNFFGGQTKYPNFNKKRNGGSAEFTRSAFKWKDGQVYLAKCAEPLSIRWNRQLPLGCIPSKITVKFDPSARWFVSLRINDTKNLKLKPITRQVGIDLGINSLVTTIDREEVAYSKNIQKLHKKLRLAQKSLSRKRDTKFNNYQKARFKVVKIHALIKDSKLDYTYKLTTRLIRENQTIVVENLAAGNMVKKHKLARAISDANCGELVRQLEYKAEWYGRTLIKLDRYFPSSKCCSNCSHIIIKLPLNIRKWNCFEYRNYHDRDINPSINILATGLAVSVWVAVFIPEEKKSLKAGAMKQKTPNSNKTGIPRCLKYSSVGRMSTDGSINNKPLAKIEQF